MDEIITKIGIEIEQMLNIVNWNKVLYFPMVE